MDARFNREDLVRRITKIADCRERIEVSRADAVEFIREKSGGFGEKDLIYFDPPYFEKGAPVVLRRLRTRGSRCGGGAVVGIGRAEVGGVLRRRRCDTQPLRVRAATSIHDRI